MNENPLENLTELQSALAKVAALTYVDKLLDDHDANVDWYNDLVHKFGVEVADAAIHRVGLIQEQLGFERKELIRAYKNSIVT